jgi:tight adherence protein B
MMQIVVMMMAGLGVGGLIVAILFPYFSTPAVSSKRLGMVAGGVDRKKGSGSLMARLGDNKKDARRKQIEESLKQLEEQEKERKKKLTLKVRLTRAGLKVNEKQFYAYSLIFGVFLALIAFIALGDADGQLKAMLAGGAFIVGLLGLPRWYLSFLAARRQNKFLNDFPDAIDIMVRGLRSGLPVTDAMKVIATEIPAPVGPEFIEVVEGQKVGIPVDQGVERMYERVPLPEVNFLSIVITIQKQTGGNLSETLSNLSRVLRDRKKMKAKIKAISQEAKSSAAIIGALPFVIMGGMQFLNPGYLNPLWETRTGNILVGVSAVWMLTGILVMRKMINFKI